jgi:lysyl-tRNA synthetase class 2
MTNDLMTKREALELRAQVMRGIRAFFEERGYLEVETPVRVKTPALEEHIDAEPSGAYWLRTSPELHMKRLICAGVERIFQIGPCFRQGERGDRHHPEYTMLEWYHAGWTASELIGETLELLRSLAGLTGNPSVAGLDQEPVQRTVAELFMQQAGWNPVADFDADRFDLDLVEKVEPWISRQPAPVFLTDFPAERAALARLSPDDSRIAERWELYLGGM